MALELKRTDTALCANHKVRYADSRARKADVRRGRGHTASDKDVAATETAAKHGKAAAGQRVALHWAVGGLAVAVLIVAVRTALLRQRRVS